MKKSLNKINNNFLNITLLKYKSLDNFLSINNSLKHALKLIYIFNSSKKVIWFVGFDSFKKINLDSNHVFLPICFWVKGLIGNSKFVKFKRKILNFQKPDLVIIFNDKINNDIIKEFTKLDVPIILFGSSKLSIKLCYINFINVSLEKNLKSFFFFWCILLLKNQLKFMLKVKKIFRPRLKKFLNSKFILNKQKLLALKKKKWKKYVNYFSRLNKKKKKNCYYKFYDQRSYSVSRFLNRFGNYFKSNLISKRRFRLLYGNLGTKYVKKIIKSSVTKSKTNVKNQFIFLLETRIDIVLLKSYFAINLRNARQLISHGNVKVNGIVIKNSSLILKNGDKINIKQEVCPLLEYRLSNNNMWPLPPKYLEINYKIFQILIILDPKNHNLYNNFNNKINVDSVLHTYKL